MRVCRKCQSEKPLDQFYKTSRGKDGLHAWCKTCVLQNNRERRAQKNPKDIASHKNRRAKATDRNQQIVWDHKLANPCVDCGEDDPIVLQLDHVRGTKVADVSTMCTAGWSLEKLYAEIAKCEVRCANCHARVTARRAGWSNQRRFPMKFPVGF